jgi:hypothetical protein
VWGGYHRRGEAAARLGSGGTGEGKGADEQGPDVNEMAEEAQLGGDSVF